MFHVELRQFPHQARAFNLTREELDARIVGPWMSVGVIELEDHRWSRDRARLTIYEGPELSSEQVGLGRGWANVTRGGEDVTERLLAEAAHPPPVAELKRAVLVHAAGGPMEMAAVVGMATERYPQARLSERIALCEQAVWELLHEGSVQLVRAAAPVTREQWQTVLLSWDAWSRDGVTLTSRS